MKQHDVPSIESRAIRRVLLAWYRRRARDLPWRRTRGPYRVWISEIMLQQTRVQAVIPYYRRFLAALPTVRDLAAASLDEVIKLWEGMGYYSRARSLHKAARIIVDQRGGKLPETADEWHRLPGVGPYTAGAIASIALNLPTPAVDGNVMRVLARLFNVKDSIDKPATRRRLWAIAEQLLPKRRAGAFNQALMDFGAIVCVPRRPRCAVCPLRRWCAAFAVGVQDERPVRAATKALPHYDIVVAAIHRNGRYLIGKRPAGGLLGGLWEFPGGKVEPGETHAQALVREVREETGLAIEVGPLLATVRHAYSHFRVTLHVYACQPPAGRVRPGYHTELKWVPRSRLDRHAFPAANRRFLSKL